MLRQMRESALCQTLHVRVVSDTQKKVFWLAQMMYAFYRTLTSFQVIRQIGRQYAN